MRALFEQRLRACARLTLSVTVTCFVAMNAWAQGIFSADTRPASVGPQAEWTVEWSPTYTEGRFGGDQTIRSLDNALILRWREGAWRASASVGHLTERGGVAPESANAPGIAVTTAPFRAWQDLQLSAGRVFSQRGSPWAAIVTARLTLPTGSADVRVDRPQPQLDVGVRWRPHPDWSSTLTLGHRWPGYKDPDVRSTWHLRAASSWSWSSDASLDFTYVQRTSRYAGEVDIREVTLGVFVDMTPTLGGGVYLIRGFGENSVARGLSTVLSWTP